MDARRAGTLQRLQASGLLGRGGSWFPVHRKWRAVLAEEGSPLVVANGGEGEPGSIKDRVIMRTRALDVVAGMRVAMDILGAERGYVYLKGSFEVERAAMHAALVRGGLASKVAIHMGDDTYVGGEETAALESIEGRRAWPRPKPPRPAAVGLFGRPTLVQNVDTLSRVAAAVAQGEPFAESDKIALTLWGDVARPGVYEVRRGRSVRDVIESEGGGPTEPIGFVFPNGAHSLPLDGGELGVSLDPQALSVVGSGLGTASIFVLGESSCVVSMIHSIARFFSRESCGQCPPCVTGSRNLVSLVTGESTSDRRVAPDGAIAETASFMGMHGYCGHSPAAARIVPALFRKFRERVAAHLANPGVACPGNKQNRDPFAPQSEELRRLVAGLDPKQ